MQQNCLSVKYDANLRVLHIIFDGGFTQELVDAFEQIYMRPEFNFKSYELDFHKLDYIDSSAVPVFLHLLEHANKYKLDICIIGMNDQVQESFCVLNLHKLFKPEYSRERYRADWVYHYQSM